MEFRKSLQKQDTINSKD